MAQEGVYVFPDANSRSNSNDLLALAALSGGNGFGGMNNPLWMMFMWPMLYPMMSMFGGFGGYGGFGGFGANGAGGVGYIANQLNNDAGRELILQALNGRADALSQLAQITNQSVSDVRAGISALNAKFAEFGGQIGMSGLQVISELKSGNASLAKQLCECCCENRLAIERQTNALQSTLANHDASVRLQLAQNEAADQLSVCQQTNALSTQADRNTNSILGAIQAQNTLITKEFCDLKERELQNKINTQGDVITQLRGQISNDKQTETFEKAFSALTERLARIESRQPNTVPVQYPNLVAANATPYVGYNAGFYPQNNFWG